MKKESCILETKNIIDLWDSVEWIQQDKLDDQKAAYPREEIERVKDL